MFKYTVHYGLRAALAAESSVTSHISDTGFFLSPLYFQTDKETGRKARAETKRGRGGKYLFSMVNIELV